MKKIKANDLVVMYKINGEWRAVAFGTSCEIDITADTIETSSPDTGRWKTYKKRKRTWRINTAHLKGDLKKTPDLLEMLDSDDTIRVCLTTVEAHPDMIGPKEYRKDGRYELTGEALVTRYTETARKGDMVTMSAELQGNGALEQMWKPWVLMDGRWTDDGVWNDDAIWE